MDNLYSGNLDNIKDLLKKELDSWGLILQNQEQEI